MAEFRGKVITVQQQSCVPAASAAVSVLSQAAMCIRD